MLQATSRRAASVMMMRRTLSSCSRKSIAAPFVTSVLSTCRVHETTRSVQFHSAATQLQSSPATSSVASSSPAAAASSASASDANHSQAQVYTVSQLLQAIQNGSIRVPVPSKVDGDASPSSLPIRLRGWLRSIRGSKATSFLQLNDGTALHSVQCVLDDAVKKQSLKEGEALSNGCSVEIEGKLVFSYKVLQQMQKQLQENPASTLSDPASTLPALLSSSASTPIPQLPVYELLATSVRLVGACDPTMYPLGKQALPLEHLRDHLHLRSRTATISSVLRIRSRAQFAIHDFFQKEGFFQVHTPILTPLDCEGAGEVFGITSSFDKPNQPFFGRPTYLTVSGQLYGEMLACSLSRVYTFGPTFRAEHSLTPRHLNEFWMVEPEVAYADLTSIMDLAEKMVKHSICDALQFNESDIRFLQGRLNPQLISTLESSSSNATPFARITYSEAIDILSKAKKAKFEFRPTWEAGLQNEHEKYLAEVHFKSPVFITNYPRASKPFYMKVDASSLATPGRETVSCFDLLIPGVGELIGGSVREENYEELKKNMITHKLDPELYKWYLDLRAYGSVPHAGFGLGFERLLRFLTNMANIRDLIPVPRTPGPAGGQF